VGAIDPKLLAAEVARVKRKARADLEAYDCFLRALDQTYPWTSEGHEEALRLLYQAIELDPDYAQAYAFAVYCYIRRFLTGRIFDAEQENELRRIAREAINRGKDDSFSLTWGGFGLAFLAPTTAQLQEGVAFIDQALLLNPNFAGAWHVSGWVRFWLGEPEIAIEHLARPMRLSPLDTGFHGMGGRDRVCAYSRGIGGLRCRICRVYRVCCRQIRFGVGGAFQAVNLRPCQCSGERGHGHAKPRAN
jgi:tetratricopeptide (TPR) repeat protein